jgi:carboxylate-amine ligase
LRSSAHVVIAEDWSGEIRKEIQESTIEIGTRVCGSAAEAEEELKRLRTQTATAAASTDLDIVAAGVHPFSVWRHHQLTAGERYARMAEMYGRIARDEHNFGMHVHVAVPPGTDRARIMNVVRSYIPHILALSCSSPIYESDDTGYASYRMILWRRWPGSGVPPRFDNERVHHAYVRSLLDAGAIGDERNLYWSIRLHPEYGTLEFRMCDVCPRIEDAVAITALIRTLVAAACAGVLREPATALPPEAVYAVLSDDSWRAARYGLDAVVMDAASGYQWQPLREAVPGLLELLMPTAESLGEASTLAGVHTILGRGNASDRIRARRAENPDLSGIVHWLAAETLINTGMDRRSEPRAILCA